MSSDSDTVEESVIASNSESSKFSTEEENPFINSLWGIHQTLATLRGMISYNLTREYSTCYTSLKSYVTYFWV